MIRRAFTGRLVGRYDPEDAAPPTPVAAPEPVVEPPKLQLVPPIKKRGRPLTGTHKKTAAEIKRDQRKRDRRELDLARLNQNQQRIYEQARQRIEADLNEAIAAGDSEKIQEIQDIIDGQKEQREYNQQLARSKKSRGGGGLFIADAPRGVGKLIYGGANIVAVGDKIATIDEEGDATFAPGQKATAYHDEGGATVHAEEVPINSEKEDQFHEKEHSPIWRRDPKRSEFDRREQEENVLALSAKYIEMVAVAILVWDGEGFSIIRNADEELRCRLCGRCFWLWRAAREHLVDNHARLIAPTSTKASRANQKLITKALRKQEAELERDAVANGWRKVDGKWVKAN